LQFVTTSFFRFISHVFPHPENYELSNKAAIICTTNESVDRFNDLILQKLPLPCATFHAADILQETDSNRNRLERLGRANVLDYAKHVSTFSTRKIPPFLLHLKENAIVYIIRNLEHGWSNGTRARVSRMGAHTVEVVSLTGSSKGETRIIPRVSCNFKVYKDIVITRRQFPLRLAFATTVHKAKGQEYQNVGLDLSHDMFAHGQAYVDFSRVPSRDNMSIFTTDSRLTPDNVPFVNNIVYPEVLPDDA